jgi:hypothetical protein
MGFRDDVVAVMKENMPVPAETQAAAVQAVASNFTNSTIEHRIRLKGIINNV